MAQQFQGGGITFDQGAGIRQNAQILQQSLSGLADQFTANKLRFLEEYKAREAAFLAKAKAAYETSGITLDAFEAGPGAAEYAQLIAARNNLGRIFGQGKEAQQGAIYDEMQRLNQNLSPAAQLYAGEAELMRRRLNPEDAYDPIYETRVTPRTPVQDVGRPVPEVSAQPFSASDRVRGTTPIPSGPPRSLSQIPAVSPTGVGLGDAYYMKDEQGNIIDPMYYQTVEGTIEAERAQDEAMARNAYRQAEVDERISNRGRRDAYSSDARARRYPKTGMNASDFRAERYPANVPGADTQYAAQAYRSSEEAARAAAQAEKDKAWLLSLPLEQRRRVLQERRLDAQGVSSLEGLAPIPALQPYDMRDRLKPRSESLSAPAESAVPAPALDERMRNIRNAGKPLTSAGSIFKVGELPGGFTDKWTNPQKEATTSQEAVLPAKERMALKVTAAKEVKAVEAAPVVADVVEKVLVGKKLDTEALMRGASAAKKLGNYFDNVAAIDDKALEALVADARKRINSMSPEELEAAGLTRIADRRDATRQLEYAGQIELKKAAMLAAAQEGKASADLVEQAVKVSDTLVKLYGQRAELMKAQGIKNAAEFTEKNKDLTAQIKTLEKMQENLSGIKTPTFTVTKGPWLWSQFKFVEEPWYTTPSQGNSSVEDAWAAMQ